MEGSLSGGKEKILITLVTRSRNWAWLLVCWGGGRGKAEQGNQSSGSN